MMDGQPVFTSFSRVFYLNRDDKRVSMKGSTEFSRQ